MSRWAIPPEDIRVVSTMATPRIAGQEERPLPTVYVGSHLLVSRTRNLADTIAGLNQIAETFGWTVREADPKPGSESLRMGVTRLLIEVIAGRPALPPDAFALLQHSRATNGNSSQIGVSLDHVLVNGEFDPLPFHFPLAFDPNPFHFPLSDGGGPSSSLMTYLQRGSGARQPVAYVGLPPSRRPKDQLGARRPVVAILDTGCADHGWFAGVAGEEAFAMVRRDVQYDGVDIGATDPTTDPDRTSGDLAGALDGEIDDVSGHGTFIAGLIHQTCPDADIVSWRVVPSAGPILEYDVTTALAQIAELAHREFEGLAHGQRIDVLSLSLGYYHETPEDLRVDSTILEILDKLTAAGVVVVCSAGNDGTTRPMLPAAFGPWADDSNPFLAPQTEPPLVVSVAATNPNKVSDAMFSNAGPWVRARGEGAAVMSTMPPHFEGGLQPVAAYTFEGRERATIDPDDFRGGFAVWSGTSFAAPVVAGRIAARLLAQSVLDADDSGEARIKRARQVVGEQRENSLG